MVGKGKEVMAEEKGSPRGFCHEGSRNGEWLGRQLAKDTLGLSRIANPLKRILVIPKRKESPPTTTP